MNQQWKESVYDDLPSCSFCKCLNLPLDQPLAHQYFSAATDKQS
jgi:hypothetical protein